jgi:PIN domain nuclease of toxin-antitoxin system
MLVSKGRLKLDIPVGDWFENVIADSGIEILPLTPRITADAFALPGTFHGEPADKLIVATARDRDCVLLTVDSKILKYPHVRTA